MLMKKIKNLGIFDSGLGGYTVFQDLKRHFPDLSMTLYADQKHAPYGNYDDETIKKLAKKSMSWFLSQGIYDVLLACNTVTSVALETIQLEFPEMRIWGIVDLTVQQLPQKDQSIGVLATVATANAHAYKNSFEKNYNGEIKEVGVQNLAAAIENLASDAEIDAIIQEALNEIGDVDTIILGCTHYPLVLDRLKKHSTAQFVDSIAPIRIFIEQNYEKSDGIKRIVSTKSSIVLKQQIEALYHEIEEVETI